MVRSPTILVERVARHMSGWKIWPVKGRINLLSGNSIANKHNGVNRLGLYNYGCSHYGDNTASLSRGLSRLKLTAKVEGSPFHPHPESTATCPLTKASLQVEGHRLWFSQDMDGLHQNFWLKICSIQEWIYLYLAFNPDKWGGGLVRGSVIQWPSDHIWL